MASSQQQHRCVFVGNIPYDATEEQLIQICEEVGPVVSFRLVVDRETGKPKGYGFCEYKDEETALSARRNLQGYEINGRQLRVDFAENDKGSDRNREQGRGGPGVAVNNEVTKQYGGPAVSWDSTLHQQVGLPLAVAAASAMARTLGGAQASTSSNLNGPPQQSLGSDPLTHHLAKMSRSQLIQIVSEMKVLATQNHDLARQLLLVCPQLSKALFQAQIMLGMVTPQMLQLPNIRQVPVPVPVPQTSLTPIQGNHQIQQPAATNIHGLPPLAPLSTPQNSLVPNQLSSLAQFPIQLPAPTKIGGTQENLVSAPLAAAPPSSAHQQPPVDTLCGPPVTGGMPPLGLRQVAHLLQNAGRSGLGSSGHGSQLTLPNTSVQRLVSSGPLLPSTGVRKGLSPHPATVDTNMDKVTAAGDGFRAGRTNRNPNMLPLSSDRNDSLQQPGRPSKLAKLDDGRGLTFSAGDLPVSTASKARIPNATGAGAIPASQSLRADDKPSVETQASQQLPAGVDSALLEQVKNLTPEQLSTLPPEQQHQVLQLQKMLR